MDAWSHCSAAVRIIVAPAERSARAYPRTKRWAAAVAAAARAAGHGARVARGAAVSARHGAGEGREAIIGYKKIF